MTRLGWVVPVVALGLVACEAPPTGACGGQDCGDGQRCDADSLTCVEDTAPTLALSAPTAVVTSDRFTVTGTARDDVAVKSVSWSLLDGGTSLAVTPDADGAFAITVPAPLTDEQGLTLVVRASDGTRETRAQATVRVDRVGPTFEWVSPAAGSTVGGETTTVEVRATDASGGLSALRIGDVTITAPASGVAASASVPVPAGLDKAQFDVEVSATDTHGNATTRHFSVLGDRVAPSLSFTSPAQDDTWVTTATLQVALLAQDPSGPVVVRVDAFDAGVVEALAGAAGAYTAVLDVPPGEATAVIRVEAVDALGNTATAERRVRVDTVPPTISLTAPAEASVHRQALQVTATTGGGVALVEARLGGAAPVAMTGSGASWSATLPVQSTDYSASSLDVTAADEAGNTATASRTVFIDTVAPTITFLAPTSGRKFNLADFGSTNDVAVSWQVTDGDAQAAVTQVNGAPSTATQLLVTTSTSDNGRVVTTTVAAADRAGNASTASRSFSVDRVAPTIIAWSPDAGVRNLELREASVTFSEPVFGATTASPGLTLTPAAGGAGSWNSAHSTWTSGALTPYAVFDATLSALADDHGNPVAAASRRFHTAALAASTPAALPLATGVAEFRVASDADGVVTVAYRTLATPNAGQQTFAVRALSPQTLTLGPDLASATSSLYAFGLNAWSVANASTLEARSVAAFSWSVPPTTGTDPITHRRRVEAGASTLPPILAQGAASALSLFALPRELDQAEFGHTLGATYTRGATSVTLPLAPDLHVAQSSDSWAGFRLEPGAVRWTRFRCNRYLSPPPAYNVCEGIAYGALTAIAPTQFSAAMNPSGTCLIATWSEGGTRKALPQPLANCDGAPATLCPSNTNLVAGSVTGGFSVAPYSAGGRNTLLAAYGVGQGVQLGTINDPAACTLALTEVGAPIPQAEVSSFAPVQLGQKAALVYVDTSGALRLYVP